MFEFFWMNVVKRRLQESPQEREYTKNDATGSHSFSLRYHLVGGWGPRTDIAEKGVPYPANKRTSTHGRVLPNRSNLLLQERCKTVRPASFSLER